VTGASGFLGRRVVDALAARGHEVRALVRPATDVTPLGWPAAVDVRRADLREPGAADAALDGVGAVVHLAAQVTGSEESRFAGTVVATENLLASMREAGVSRMVLAGSFSVYDWSAPWRDEATPLEREPGIYERDGYAVAKWWQERVVRRAAERDGLALTVLRPGFVWGPGSELVDGVGQRLGGARLVFGPAGRLPLTHVENCADCFAAALESDAAVGAALNVVDGDAPRTWRYARDAGDGAARVPVPYALAFALVRLVHGAARAVLGPRLRVPSIFVPRRFEARFKPLRASGAQARRVLGWTPPVPYEEALRR
jgi:UDP-glucose 4-epimerase